jgi:hypothetical protein
MQHSGLRCHHYLPIPVLACIFSFMSSHDVSPLLRYPLLLPHIFMLCIKYRMLPSDIIHANPAMPMGGLPFSPKDQICDLFNGVLPYTVVSRKLSLREKLYKAESFAVHYGYPVIVKPNGGHRGIDIHLAEKTSDFEDIFSNQTWDYMLQQYCPYQYEFGVFYCRIPGEKDGSIVSLTQKVIPVLVGDGISTIEKLIDVSDIINKLAIQEALFDEKDYVPAAGVSVNTLVAASHSRGSMFKDVVYLETPDLLKEINRLCTIDGFYFGRLDVRSESIEAFQRGEFEIIEINGATSEMIHIYDSQITLLEGLKVLKKQWSLLFKIAALCRDRSKSIPFFRFISLYRSFYLSTKTAIGKLW